MLKAGRENQAEGSKTRKKELKVTEVLCKIAEGKLQRDIFYDTVIWITSNQKILIRAV